MPTFTSFPPEIISETFSYLHQCDLAQICQVSKSLLEIARPLLYRTISFELDTWIDSTDDRSSYLEYVEDLNGGEGSLRYRVDKDHERDRTDLDTLLLDTLDSNPEWCRWVQEVDVNYTDITEDGLRRLVAHVGSMQNLRTFIGGPGVEHPRLRPFWQALPNTLVNLNLSSSEMSPSDYLRICGMFPSLRKLGIGYGTTVPFVEGSAPSPHLPLLRFLTLASDLNKNFFTALTSSTQSLAALEINFVSAQSVDLRRVSTLKELSVYGKSGDEYFDAVLAIVDATTELEAFTLFVDKFFGSEAANVNENERLLKRLPSTLVDLTLLHLALTADQLVHVVRRLSPTLKSLRTCRQYVDEYQRYQAGVECDKEGLDKLEKVCKENGVELKWGDDRSILRRW